MDLKQFDKAIDAIEIDPRPRIKAVIRKLRGRELDAADISPDLAAALAGPLLAEAASRMQELLEQRPTVDALLDRFAAELRRAVVRERSSGSLKCVSPESELSRAAVALAEHGYGGLEIDALRALLQPSGERIVEIRFRSITTSHNRQFTREQLRAHFKPITWTGPAQTWLRQFKSDDEIRALETAANESRAAQERAPWADSRNLDLDRR